MRRYRPASALSQRELTDGATDDLLRPIVIFGQTLASLARDAALVAPWPPREDSRGATGRHARTAQALRASFPYAIEVEPLPMAFATAALALPVMLTMVGRAVMARAGIDRRTLRRLRGRNDCTRRRSHEIRNHHRGRERTVRAGR